MKKRVSILLVLALIASLFAMPALADQELVDLKGKLVILHTNDIHGYAVTDPSEPAMGYAQIALLKQQAVKEGASVLLLDAGDASQGQPIVNLSSGANAFAFMNAVGYDAMCPGNHEYDWGSDAFLQNAETANFPILAANILRTSDKQLIFAANKIFDLDNGMKVGVFGLATPETLTKANPELMKGLTFLMKEELYACAQAQVDELKAAGCDLIVCLGHLGVDDESIGNRSIDVIAATNGIDLFIDGHSHSELGEKVDQKPVEGAESVPQTLLVSTGSYGHNLGEVVYDGESLRCALQPASPAMIMANQGDETVGALVNGINAEIDAELSAVFAKTEVDLEATKAIVRSQETNLGDFATDAMLWAANRMNPVPVVAAINNGGGIRASIPAGDITMKDMKTVFPYGNVVVTMTLTGSELLEILEAATCTTPEPIGAFPQVSGIVFTVDTTVPYENGEQYPDSTYYAPAKPGARVTIESVGGEPFDLEKDYVIATNDFSASGGDTYYAFRYAYQQTGNNIGLALEDALTTYVADELGGVIGQQYAAPQGRITIK